MKRSKAHEVTLRAVLEMLFMYLCPHLVRWQTLISPEVCVCVCVRAPGLNSAKCDTESASM